MKLKISLQELGTVATNKQLTYEQATFYSTLYSLLLNCIGKGTESQNINNAKKIIDLLVAHGLEQEIASSYHKLKAQTPDEVQQELEAQQTVSNLIVYVWFKYCQEKSNLSTC